MTATDRPSDRAVELALNAIGEAATMPPEMARDYIEALAGCGIHFMRAKFGDEYAKGWLDHALSDLDRPPLMTLRKPQ